MKAFRFLTVVSLLLVCFVFSASAQRNRRPAPRPTPTPSKPYINPVISVAKMQVENQLFNINLFVDRLGPIAVIIENADKEAAAGRLKADLKAKNDSNKQRTLAAIRGMREPIVALETDFRTKSVLMQYLPKIQGISALFAQAEDHAIAGQFVAAKDPLREVALKLNDTLAVLPGPGSTGSPVNSSASRPAPAQPRPESNTPVSAAKSDVAVGMTPEQVLASSWGAPVRKRTSSATTEVWTYSGNRAVYFYRGKVSNIVR